MATNEAKPGFTSRQPMPRLSETLAGPKDAHHCQACGQVVLTPAGERDSPLERWQECDEGDRAEPIVVVLCHPCAARLVPPHPRLYRQLPAWEPFPGCMAVCGDCLRRDGNRCTHPDARYNGGAGVLLTLPKPFHVHLQRSPRWGSGWTNLWRGPVTACRQKEVPGAAALFDEG